MSHVVLRAQNPFDEEDWTEACFTGPFASDLSAMLAADLCRLEWKVLLSYNGEDFITLGEDEDES